MTIRHETDAKTVGDLLAELETTYPDLEGELLSPDREALAEEAVVTANTRHVTQLEGLETPLEPDDVIRLVPAVHGG